MGAFRTRCEYDVVVVGAGPAGAVAARTAAERGARVLLLESRREIGRPVQCTGLLSVRGFEASGAPRDVILREIRGVFTYGPGGERLTLEKRATHAYVIDRDRFDLALVEQAIRAGVEVRLKSPAVGLERSSGVQTLYVKSDGHRAAVRACVVIGADGPKSVIARAAGLPAPQKLIIGVQAVIEYRPPREDFVEVWLSRAIAPNFFAWAVPAAPGTARVGLGTDNPTQAKALFDRWIERQFPDREILGFQSGAIPIGPAARTATDGVLLVGDAAGQAKPTSGGGIYTGISCAKIAGEVAAQAALAGDASEHALAEYERRWRGLFEGELRFGWRLHRTLCRLSDDELVAIFRAADEPRLTALLSEHGDIDYPSRVAKALLKRPDLWGRLLQATPRKTTMLWPLVSALL